jgi:transposase-like protein
MRTSKFKDAQIVAILREEEAGMAVTELLRKHDINRPTFYRWIAEARRGRPARTAAFKSVGAGECEAQMDVRRSCARARGDQGCVDQKTVTRSARRAAVTSLTQEHAQSVQRAV